MTAHIGGRCTTPSYPDTVHLSFGTGGVPRAKSNTDVKNHHAKGAEMVRRGFWIPRGW
jgi:hypothetical protein